MKAAPRGITTVVAARALVPRATATAAVSYPAGSEARDPMNRVDPSPAVAAFPDPIISANLYDFRRLDRVIARFVVPFLLAAEAKALDQPFYLWMLRYLRGGEHLKIRVHAPDALR